MSGSNRKLFETATVLDQTFLDFSHDNLSNQLEMVAEISVPAASSFPTDKIYVSDRNKYVGEHFYEARTTFPVIKRTIGTYLAPDVAFGSLRLKINNADGKFNEILPGGVNYNLMLNQTVEVRLGLRDVESTYTTIFSGAITDIGGVNREVSSFTVTARDKFDIMKAKYPTTTFTTTSYPDIADDLIGQIIPYCYGDWTVELNPESGSSVLAFPVNTLNASVISGVANVEMVISQNVNVLFDNTKVVLLRSSKYYPVASADISNIVNNNSFEIAQGGTTLVEGVAYTFEEGDEFFCQVKGKNVSAYDDNPVAIARDILVSFGGLSDPADFDSSWDTIRDKVDGAAPEDSVANIKARLWIQDQQAALTSALSLLEQVRVEAFINRSQKVELSTLHFTDFAVATSKLTVRNWDIERESFKPRLDLRNQINRAKGFFNRLPDLDDNFYKTNFFKNQNAIDQIGKVVEKGLVFPNLYIRSDVNNQVEESLRLTSGFFEEIEVTQTWRSLLLEISDFVTMDINIGSTVFEQIPCLVRDIGYSAKGLKIPIKYWSFMVLPYTGWAGVGGGIVAGSTATIEEET
jgi:hypothetical protein